MKKKVLVIAPHPDDETLGFGGSMAKLISEGNDVYVLTVSGHLPPLYNKKDYDRTIKEAYKAYDILGVKKSKFLEIPATMIDDEPLYKLNNKISSIINEYKPDIIFSCWEHDTHQDHKSLAHILFAATRKISGAGFPFETSVSSPVTTVWKIENHSR